MEWWKSGNLVIPYNNKNFKKILEFYLFNCPVVIKGGKVSKRAKSFEDYKIVNQGLKTLLSLMKRDLADANNNYRCIKLTDDIERNRIELERFSKLNDEYYNFIVFKENDEIGKTRTIYYAIRNSLAHGSFSIKSTKKENIYYFETSKDGKLKAQIRLKERTLLHWIDLIKEFSKSKRKKQQKEMIKQ